jgi:hypothetical protein
MSFCAMLEVRDLLRGMERESDDVDAAMRVRHYIHQVGMQPN